MKKGLQRNQNWSQLLRINGECVKNLVQNICPLRLKIHRSSFVNDCDWWCGASCCYLENMSVDVQLVSPE